MKRQEQGESTYIIETQTDGRVHCTTVNPWAPTMDSNKRHYMFDDYKAKIYLPIDLIDKLFFSNKASIVCWLAPRPHSVCDTLSNYLNGQPSLITSPFGGQQLS